MLRLAALVVAGAFAPAPAVRAETVVDLELALAVDASASVDDAEFRLQLDGLAAAFEQPEIVAAIRSGPLGAIAVSILIWAEATVPPDQSDWFVLRSAADASRFAARLTRQRRTRTGGTGLGAGLASAMRSFDRNGIAAARQVVDVSGDGAETPPREIVVTMPAARSQALSRGVTINGLAIANEDPELGAWYRRNVAVGADSFVMVALDYAAYATAIRRKLLREIRHRPRLSRPRQRRFGPGGTSRAAIGSAGVAVRGTAAGADVGDAPKAFDQTRNPSMKPGPATQFAPSCPQNTAPAPNCTPPGRMAGSPSP